MPSTSNGREKVRMMNTGVGVLAMAVIIGIVNPPPIQAQSKDASRPEFEVASVRRSTPPQDGSGIRDGVSGGPGTADPSLIAYSNLRLKDLLMTAWGVKGYQVFGPDWIESERYDIVARIPPGTSKEQFSIMLQNLLTERFKLTILHTQRELPVFELVVAKNGPKLKPWVQDPETLNASPAPEPSPGLPIGADGYPIARPGQLVLIPSGNARFRIAARKAGVAKLADRLSSRLDRPVLDKSGLSASTTTNLNSLVRARRRLRTRICLAFSLPCRINLG